MAETETASEPGSVTSALDRPKGRKARQATRERLRANHAGVEITSRPKARRESASSAGEGSVGDEVQLEKLKEVRSELEAAGALQALPEDGVAPQARRWSEAEREGRTRVQIKEWIAGAVPPPQAATTMVEAMDESPPFCLAPEVALGLIPSEARSHALSDSLATGQPLPTTVPWQLRGMDHIPPALAPPAYCEILSAVCAVTPKPLPVAPIQMSYEDVMAQTVGPAALDPDMQMSIQEYGRSVFVPRGTYVNQGQEVKLPPGRPDYGRQIAKIELPPANVYGRRTQMMVKKQLDEAIANNAEIRKVFQRDVARMQRSIPRPHGAPAPAVDVAGPERPTGLGLLQGHQYGRVKLEIQVVKATDIPHAEFLASTDPYVMVSVVDGNPLQDPQALKGFEDWRALHEQWSAQTRVVEGSAEAHFRAGFFCEVRNREVTHVHFRLFDQDSIAYADRPIGQAVLPLSDVFTDEWSAPRAMALRPMDAKDQKAWKAVAKTRLHVSINWEGVFNSVKAENLQGVSAAAGVSGFAQGGHGRRSPRRKKAEEGAAGGGLGGFFGYFDGGDGEEEEEAPS